MRLLAGATDVHEPTPEDVADREEALEPPEAGAASAVATGAGADGPATAAGAGAKRARPGGAEAGASESSAVKRAATGSLGGSYPYSVVVKPSGPPPTWEVALYALLILERADVRGILSDKRAAEGDRRARLANVPFPAGDYSSKKPAEGESERLLGGAVQALRRLAHCHSRELEGCAAVLGGTAWSLYDVRMHPTSLYRFVHEVGAKAARYAPGGNKARWTFFKNRICTILLDPVLGSILSSTLSVVRDSFGAKKSEWWLPWGVSTAPFDGFITVITVCVSYRVSYSMMYVSCMM